MNPLRNSLWIFCCEFSRPDIARKTIESVVGESARIDSEGMFVFGIDFNIYLKILKYYG